MGEEGKKLTLDELAIMMDEDLKSLRSDSINLQKARELVRTYTVRLRVLDLKIKAVELLARYSDAPIPKLEL